jgi:hypothetical protein
MSSCEGDLSVSERATSHPSFAVIGVNHRDTPISLRERLSILPSELPEILARIRALNGVEEVVVLSTCNRVELYASWDMAGGGVLKSLALDLCEARGVPYEDVKGSFYEFTGLDEGGVPRRGRYRDERSLPLAPLPDDLQSGKGRAEPHGHFEAPGVRRYSRRRPRAEGVRTVG